MLFGPTICKAEPWNPVVVYLTNAELQYEGEVQKENIKMALQDILASNEKELAAKRYKDYSSRTGQWSLQTLIHKHFVLNNQMAALGDNFYQGIRSDEVKAIIRGLLRKLE